MTDDEDDVHVRLTSSGAVVKGRASSGVRLGGVVHRLVGLGRVGSLAE